VVNTKLSVLSFLFFLSFWIGLGSILAVLVPVMVLGNFGLRSEWLTDSDKILAAEAAGNTLLLIYIVCSVILSLDYFSWVLTSKTLPLGRTRMFSLGIAFFSVVPYVYYWRIVVRPGGTLKPVLDVFELLRSADKRYKQ
jgi:hypothetical protein